MEEVYLCMRVNHGDRLGGCEDTVEHVVVCKKPENAINWLLSETLIERDLRTDDDLYFVNQMPPMENGSLNQDLALKMLLRNGEIRIVTFDAYEGNYDSFAEAVVKRTTLI